MYSCSLLVLHCRDGGRGKSQAKTSWAKNQAKSKAVLEGPIHFTFFKGLALVAFLLLSPKGFVAGVAAF